MLIPGASGSSVLIASLILYILVCHTLGQWLFTKEVILNAVLTYIGTGIFLLFAWGMAIGIENMVTP